MTVFRTEPSHEGVVLRFGAGKESRLQVHLIAVSTDEIIFLWLDFDFKIRVAVIGHADIAIYRYYLPFDGSIYILLKAGDFYRCLVALFYAAPV